MNDEQRSEILAAIRKGGVAINEEDPIFAILTANEICLEDHLAKVDIQNMEFFAKLKSFTKEIQDEAKNLAEVRISKAVNGAFERLDDYKKEIEEVKAPPPPPEPNKDLGNKPGVYYALVPIFAAASGFTAALLIL